MRKLESDRGVAGLGSWGGAGVARLADAAAAETSASATGLAVRHCSLQLSGMEERLLRLEGGQRSVSEAVGDVRRQLGRAGDDADRAGRQAVLAAGTAAAAADDRLVSARAGAVATSIRSTRRLLPLSATRGCTPLASRTESSQTPSVAGVTDVASRGAGGHGTTTGCGNRRHCRAAGSGPGSPTRSGLPAFPAVFLPFFCRFSAVCEVCPTRPLIGHFVSRFLH